jgi:nitrogen regulatory protein PII
MKRIEAIIRLSKFDDVKESLYEAGIKFFTFYEVKGCGHEPNQNLQYRGSHYDLGYIPRIQLEIFVSDNFVKPAIASIKKAAHTEEFGDGLIIVSNVEEIVNIRTGLRNGESINN